MNFSEYHYYKFTIDLLRYLGLWNLNAGWLERFQRLAVCTLFTTGILCQITAYFTNEYDLQMISRSVVFIVGSFMFLDQYVLFYANIDRMRTLFARLQQDWNTVRGVHEYNILKEYTENGKFVTNLHVACFVPILLCIVVLEFLPNILNVVAPLNQSRPQQFPIMAEFFLEDSTSKYIFIYVAADVTLVVGATTLIASETFVFMLIEHVCAMFKITGYETSWYRIPLPAQKLIIFIMQRSMKSNTMMLYGLYVPSRQGFTMLCNTMISYLTFLCSVQN
ncbi:uncharacterized protein LOC143433200 [Xylocopa sonorina]|uniref:uncharacterized protein LOC143433200 n=1 Tax=Xylocopa sonorina TaxID=1818115 RepID=UPI00403B0EC3